MLTLPTIEFWQEWKLRLLFNGQYDNQVDKSYHFDIFLSFYWGYLSTSFWQRKPLYNLQVFACW